MKFDSGQVRAIRRSFEKALVRHQEQRDEYFGGDCAGNPTFQGEYESAALTEIAANQGWSVEDLELEIERPGSELHALLNGVRRSVADHFRSYNQVQSAVRMWQRLPGNEGLSEDEILQNAHTAISQLGEKFHSVWPHSRGGDNSVLLRLLGEIERNLIADISTLSDKRNMLSPEDPVENVRLNSILDAEKVLIDRLFEMEAAYKGSAYVEHREMRDVGPEPFPFTPAS